MGATNQLAAAADVSSFDKYKFLFVMYADITNRPAKQDRILIRKTVKKKKFFITEKI